MCWGCCGAVDRSRLHRLLQTLDVPSHRIGITSRQDAPAARIQTPAGEGSLGNQTAQREKGFDFFPETKQFVWPPPTNDLTGKVVKLRITGVKEEGVQGELASSIK